MITNKEKEEVKLHLNDIINECSCKRHDIKQIEHNVCEIAEHLGIELK
jgi:hypothetical protein